MAQTVFDWVTARGSKTTTLSAEQCFSSVNAPAMRVVECAASLRPYRATTERAHGAFQNLLSCGQRQSHIALKLLQRLGETVNQDKSTYPCTAPPPSQSPGVALRQSRHRLANTDPV